MESHKEKFIEFLLSTGALILSDKSLKSKRLSPYFVNTGGFNDGASVTRLGEAYADTILANKVDLDLVFGPAYKGVPLVITTSMALAAKNNNVGWVFDRKEAKVHGEATGADLQQQILVGSKIKDGSRVVILDDVITTGGTKYEALELLTRMAKDVSIPALVIAVDRQEVGIDGASAIEAFTAQTKVPVHSIVTSTEIMNYLKSKPDFAEAAQRMENYLRVYGTLAARSQFSPLEQRVIARDRSIIPACDVETLEQFEKLVEQTASVDGIGGYKLGFGLGLRYGLPRVVEVARKHTTKPLIYDHQKAGTDIPDTGKDFAKLNKEAGIDTVILFPQAGPETERAWIYHARDHGLKVIVGGRMTHPAYATSEGGFIADEGALAMYRIAAQAGVTDFVVPGNKPDVIAQVKETVMTEGVKEPIFYAPGFVAQGGKIDDAAKIAGSKFHGIVGRGIYTAKDMRLAAIEHSQNL